MTVHKSCIEAGSDVEGPGNFRGNTPAAAALEEVPENRGKTVHFGREWICWLMEGDRWEW